MIAFLLTACAAGVAGDAAPTGDTVKDWVMPEAERAAVIAVVERAITAGLPDAKGARIHIGTVSVARTHGGVGMITEEESFAGVHLHLADGRWLVQALHLLQPGSAITVDAHDAPETSLGEFTKQAEAHAQRNRGIVCSFGTMDELAGFAPDQFDMVRTVGRAGALTSLLRVVDGPAVVAAHLIRLGAPRAELLAVHLGIQEQWNDHSALWSPTAAPLRLVDARMEPMWGGVAEEAVQIFRVPPPGVALRRALISHFAFPPSPASLLFIPVPVQAALGAAQALTDDGDVQARTAISQLRARLAIPAQPPAGVDLAARLAAWGFLSPDLYQQFGEDELTALLKLPSAELAEMTGPREREMVEEYRRWPTFTAADVGALIALAGDDRPSRWLDEGGVRTVGDNALRALTRIFGCDPRVFIKRAVNAPWTAAERAATAQALATWWQASKDRKPEQIMLDSLGDLSLNEIARLVIHADEPKRIALLDRLVTTWEREPPLAADQQLVADLLRLADRHAGIAVTVGSWPVTGNLSTILAAWHLGRGNSAPVDAMFAALVKPEPGKTEPAKAVDQQAPAPTGWSIGALVDIAARYPTGDYFQRLRVVLVGPPDHEPCSGLLGALFYVDQSLSRRALSVLWGDEHRGSLYDPSLPADVQVLKARAALQLGLLGGLLGDQRSAPEALIESVAMWISTGRTVGDKETTRAKDLRLCDIAAFMVTQLSSHLQLDLLVGEGTSQRLRNEPIDLTADRAQRDRTIAKMRQLVATALPPALSAAKLPPVLPGITDLPTVGDDKAAF